AEPSTSKIFIVNNNSDTSDGAYADGICEDALGKCTLRAALEEARSRAGNYFITFSLPLPAVINLTLGELVIERSVTVVGPGAAKLTVQRSAATGTDDFRIFFIGRGNEDTSVRIYGLTIANGRGLVGGGLYNRPGSTLSLTDVAVSNNTAYGAGGIVNFGTMTINRSLINGNRAVVANVPNPIPASGGGINNNAGTITVANSTVTDNEAISGGGIDNFGTVNLVNVTVSHNSALQSGSGILNRSGAAVTVRNTIIADNNSSTATDASGAFNSLGNNLIADDNDNTGFINGVNGDQIGTGGVTINPLLGMLTNNGGQTKTRALLPGSPAIDSGNNCVLNVNCPTNNLPFPLRTDQRDYRRSSSGTVDVGAFELNAFGGGVSNSSLAGTVFEPGGRAASGAIVRLISPTGAIAYAVTNPFGRFRFSSIWTNETFIIEIRYKRYAFTPQVFPPF
ncbi:MAG TPA: carboxypeptidase-like regulatory domain-containing protein, partial [Pyrinomonadaceae bacterium]|nr:carboxypeptidase-like regulatory domain-containing protein [Pyrinomonadaceae bacterium]